jgi:hypothetical protein
MQHYSILDITRKILFSNRLQGQRKINISENINQAGLYYISNHTSSGVATKNLIK